MGLMYFASVMGLLVVLFLFMCFSVLNSVGLLCSLCCIGFVFGLYWLVFLLLVVVALWFDCGWF